MRHISRLLAVGVAAVTLAACDGTVDDKDRAMWERNAADWDQTQRTGGRGFR